MGVFFAPKNAPLSAWGFSSLLKPPIRIFNVCSPKNNRTIKFFAVFLHIWLDEKILRCYAGRNSVFIMADIKKALTEEIRRLAKKEIKAAVEPLAAKIAELKKLVSAQAKEIKASKSPMRKSAEASKAAAAEADREVRLNAAGIKRVRSKLGVSQAVFAKLVGVNALSVSHWELGKSEPRKEFKSRIAALRNVGKRNLAKRLADAGES